MTFINKIIKCKECNKEFSSDAKVCPQCGSKKNRNFINKHPIWTIIILLVTGNIIFDIVNNAPQTKQEIVIKSNWSYEIMEDKVQEVNIKLATNVSPEILDYNNNRMRITLTLKDKQSNIILDIKEKGSFSCYSIMKKCTMKVKFDNKPIRIFEYNEYSNKETVFIVETDEFIKELKESKNMIVEADLLNRSNQQFEFNIQDLKW